MSVVAVAVDVSGQAAGLLAEVFGIELVPAGVIEERGAEQRSMFQIH